MNEKILNKQFRDAIKNSDLNEVKRLVMDHPEALHAITPFGTWLHVAAKRGKLKIVEYFVQKGINVNTRGDVFDASPLRVAAGAGHLETVKYLIENGAALDVSTAKRNPLFGAIYGGHTEVAKLLVEKGIDFSMKYTGENRDDMDAFQYAKEFGQMDIANYLEDSRRRITNKNSKNLLQD